MNAEKFFQQIRQYINNNAVEPRPGGRATNLGLMVGDYELCIEGRGRGRGYVTIRRNQVMIANECTPPHGTERHTLYNADDAVGATLAILEKQDKQRGEDAIALGDDVPLQMDVNDDRRAEKEQTPIEKARQMIAEGTASGRLIAEVASADRMANIIATCLLEGREPGRNVRDALMSSEVSIKREVAQ